MLNKYKDTQVKKLPRWFPFRGFFTFAGVIYLHPVLYGYWQSRDSYVVAEAVKTLEHEHTHITQLKELGYFKFFLGCLPWYPTSPIEMAAIKAGNIAKAAFLRNEVNRYGRST